MIPQKFLSLAPQELHRVAEKMTHIYKERFTCIQLTFLGNNFWDIFDSQSYKIYKDVILYFFEGNMSYLYLKHPLINKYLYWVSMCFQIPIDFDYLIGFSLRLLCEQISSSLLEVSVKTMEIWLWIVIFECISMYCFDWKNDNS